MTAPCGLQAFHRLLLEADARMVNNGLQGIVGPNGEPLPAWAEFNADRQYWMDHFLRVSKVTRTADTQFTYKQWLSDGHSVRAVVTRCAAALATLWFSVTKRLHSTVLMWLLVVCSSSCFGLA